MRPVNLLKTLCGFVALLLGAVGLVLPVWPTTPFVLLAIGCFGTNPRARAQIMKIQFFRTYYESYTEKKELPVKNLVGSLCFLWTMLILSMLAMNRISIVLILLTVGVLVTLHLFAVSRLNFRKKRSDRTPHDKK